MIIKIRLNLGFPPTSTQTPNQTALDYTLNHWILDLLQTFILVWQSAWIVRPMISNSTTSSRVSNSFKNQSINLFSLATNYTFNNKKRTGQGWPALLKNSKSAHYVRKNALHIIFQMEVLGTTPNPRADDDRYTFFNWSLNAFTKSMLPKNISDGFEWRSSSFALASAPHLKLRLVLLCKEGQDSVKLCMVPAKLKNAKVQMSYLIWVEDRNGIRLPTWGKSFWKILGKY